MDEGKGSGGHIPRTQALGLGPLPVPDQAKRHVSGRYSARGPQEAVTAHPPPRMESV